MKKIIFGLIAFGIVCFAATGVLIYKHNEEILAKDNNQENKSNGNKSPPNNKHFKLLDITLIFSDIIILNKYISL